MPIDSNLHTLVIDQGTSSSKVFLFNLDHKPVFTDRVKHQLLRPAPHCVETDAAEIGEAVYQLIKKAIQYSKENKLTILSAGMALQRSTFLFWEKDTKQPLTATLSWQDGRAHGEVSKLSRYKKEIFKKTGAPLNAHFGGPKFLHLVRKNPNLKEIINANQLFFGPISAFLTHRLTGNAAIDHTIASRTLVMDLDSLGWDEGLLSIFEMSKDVLPLLVPAIHDFGQISCEGLAIPLKCVIGDQQAALIGQAGDKPGSVAMNFGTSGSVQINSGSKPIHISGLISSVLVSSEKEKTYLLEGTINACNSLFHWLEDYLNIPHNEMQWEKRCEHKETGGVFVPGFSGLAAPHWRDRLKTISEGYINKRDVDEIVRAAMESIGFLVYDIWALSEKHIQTKPGLVTASGGGARKPLLQFISHLTELNVGHVTMKDRTALGVHRLLLKSEGISPGNLKGVCDEVFSGNWTQSLKVKKLKKWRAALRKAGVTDC